MIVLVQGTGVAEAAPNPDGSLSKPNRDFITQGIGNLASGIFRGQPVGGSADRHNPAHRLPSQIAFSATLAATLCLPVTAAVGIGVMLSLLVQVNQEAIDLTVVRLKRGQDGGFIEPPAPTILPSQEVTLLDVYGSLRVAGARTLQTRLPDPAPAGRPVVVLRLRGRSTLGSTTFIASPTTPSGSAQAADICSSAAWTPASSSSCRKPTASTCETMRR